MLWWDVQVPSAVTLSAVTMKKQSEAYTDLTSSSSKQTINAQIAFSRT